jgi:hypothetical protein
MLPLLTAMIVQASAYNFPPLWIGIQPPTRICAPSERKSTKGCLVVPGVVTGDSDDYATIVPNLVDSRATSVGTLPTVSMAKLAPARGAGRAFLRRSPARTEATGFAAKTRPQNGNMS